MDGLLPIEARGNEVLDLYLGKVRSLMLDFLTTEDAAERARAIGILYDQEMSRTFAELLVDLEADPAARALVVGMLRA